MYLYIYTHKTIPTNQHYIILLNNALSRPDMHFVRVFFVFPLHRGFYNFLLF